MATQIFFYFHLYLGKISNLTNIFQMGWNHQLGNVVMVMMSQHPGYLFFFETAAPRDEDEIKDFIEAQMHPPCWAEKTFFFCRAKLDSFSTFFTVAFESSLFWIHQVSPGFNVLTWIGFNSFGTNGGPLNTFWTLSLSYMNRNIEKDHYIFINLYIYGPLAKHKVSSHAWKDSRMWRPL